MRPNSLEEERLSTRFFYSDNLQKNCFLVFYISIRLRKKVYTVQLYVKARFMYTCRTFSRLFKKIVQEFKLFFDPLEFLQYSLQFLNNKKNLY